MAVWEITHWSIEGKLSAVDHVLRNPHKYTVDDLAWAKKTFDMDVPQVRAHFALLRKLAFVYRNDAAQLPVYLWGVDGNGQIHTLSHVDLEGYKVGMTKDVLRFMRTEEGKKFFEGTIGIAETSDTTPALVAWAAKLGFAQYAQKSYSGQTFNYFHKGA
jgi:hypothetical protein